MRHKPSELSTLPPSWASNYSAQIVHRLLPILQAVDDLSKSWQNEHYAWLCGNELDEGEAEPQLPEEFLTVKKLLNKLLE